MMRERKRREFELEGYGRKSFHCSLCWRKSFDFICICVWENFSKPSKPTVWCFGGTRDHLIKLPLAPYLDRPRGLLQMAELLEPMYNEARRSGFTQVEVDELAPSWVRSRSGFEWIWISDVEKNKKNRKTSWTELDSIGISHKAHKES